MALGTRIAIFCLLIGAAASIIFLSAAHSPSDRLPETEEVAYITDPESPEDLASVLEENSETKAIPVTSDVGVTPLPDPEVRPVRRDALIGTPTTIGVTNENVRGSLVNIICIASAPLKSITGSGVFIDSSGVILTNAHVAQYFLLKDTPTKNATTCIVRTGSPAKTMYTAELVYISPTWVRTNAYQLLSTNPRGTGEDDYALIKITGPLGQNTLPSSFPSLAFDITPDVSITGDTMVVGGYPAGLLSGASILTNLVAVTSVATVKDLYTFTENTPDLMSLGGTAVAQRGSSGGAVVRSDSVLAGLIVTSTEGKTTDEREMRAITLFHVNESLMQDTGFSLYGFINELAVQKQQFQESVAPTLTALLARQLER